MRILEYRAPRALVQFGVDFVAGQDFFRGVCVDISEKGLRASFEETLSVGKVGNAIIRHPLCRMTIPARVVYLVKNQAGLAFFEHNVHDREALSHLMSTLGM